MWLPAYLLISLVLYFVTILILAGPLYWTVYDAYYVDGSRLAAAYFYPLALACEFEPFGRFVDWYVGLWVL
ncbi:hypothetical protein [Stratiformator vulcanicus]|nr:hypothetical protein [Stratiformator vulcanicus]